MEERAKFLADVDRRGPPVLWVHCQKPETSRLDPVERCSLHSSKSSTSYVLQVPVGCDVDEKKELAKLLGEARCAQ